MNRWKHCRSEALKSIVFPVQHIEPARYQKLLFPNSNIEFSTRPTIKYVIKKSYWCKPWVFWILACVDVCEICIVNQNFKWVLIQYIPWRNFRLFAGCEARLMWQKNFWNIVIPNEAMKPIAKLQFHYVYRWDRAWDTSWVLFLSNETFSDDVNTCR